MCGRTSSIATGFAGGGSGRSDGAATTRDGSGGGPGLGGGLGRGVGSRGGQAVELGGGFGASVPVAPGSHPPPSIEVGHEAEEALASSLTT